MRDMTVDIVKGFAILTVVFAHVTMGLEASGQLSTEFILVTMPFYVWYMPIFFFASGLFLEKSLTRVDGLRFVGRKAVELGYPYVIWSLIFGGLQMLFSGYTNTGSISLATVLSGVFPWSPREHMWFLPALFVVFAAAAACFSLWRRRWKWIFLALGVGGFFAGMSVTGHSQLLQYAIWTALGVAAGSGWRGGTGWILGRSRITKDILLFVSALIGFVVTAIFGLGPGRNFLDRGVVFVLACWLGITCIFALSKVLAQDKRITSILAPFGRASLHIYLTHVPILAAVRVLLTKVLDWTYQPAVIAISVLSCLLFGLGVAVLDRRGVVSVFFKFPNRSTSSRPVKENDQGVEVR